MNSLRVRLLAGAAAFVLVALAIAAVGLTYLFRRDVAAWADTGLVVQLDQLIAGIDNDAEGKLAMLRPPSDPRFQQALSGRYWQVSIEPSGPVFRSRSLWDFEIESPPEEHVDDRVHGYNVPGPGNQTLHLLQRRIQLPPRLGDRTARVAIGINNADLTAAVYRFAGALFPFLAILAALLTAAAWAQVTIGLRPLAAMRRKLADVGTGAARRLGSGFPDEVRPLAREIDTLLEAREVQIEKARARAADLAHGLKTPLQLLSDTSERLRGKGGDQVAEEIEDVVATMRRYIERELVRVRSGANATNVSANVANVATRVVRVVERTPEGKRVSWTVDVPPGLLARIDADDLTEALGNLAENAARHASSSVTVQARGDNDYVIVTVIDDGCGIPADRAQEALRRGGRLDSSGSAGLGLAIVGDVAEAWKGTVAIEAPSHGCRIVLRIPSARF